MHCPKCGRENPEQARFCLKCGAKLALACPKCGTELPLDAQFCFACGAQVAAPTEAPLETVSDALKRLIPKEYAERLLATRGQPHDERRTVTILFSDIKGSTAMLEKLDPEDAKEIILGVFEFLIAPIFRYEGTLVQLMGDAILAFFGAPIAHEDDPERACRAALDITAKAAEYAEKLERERGIRGFNVRVGINTGLVVVGEVGSDLRVAYTAVGDAINLAARMEQNAEPGTVLITEATHKRIAPLFETQALGPLQVKGKAEPVSTYHVLAAKEMPGKVRGIAGLESPLVARQAEFAALQEALERLHAGVGGIVTIVGEAGIGKSRLVVEARAGARHGSPLQWVEGRCLSYGTSIAYQLWLDMLRSVLGATGNTTPAQARERLREWVQALCPKRSDDVFPYLARLISLPLDDKHRAPLDGMDGQQLKTCTFQAIETLIECAATQQPVVIVAEDLHWADPTSVELLEQLLSLTDRAPVLFLCLFRRHIEHGSWRILETATRFYPHRHTELRLGPLSASESETLLRNLLQAEDLPTTLKQRILSEAEGNPFYIEEIIRSLIDQGVFRQDPATGHWQVAGDWTDSSIPDTLQGLLMARVDCLPEEAKRVLQTAAVIGRIFPYRLLATVVGGVSPGLHAHLLRLQREGMIRERARWPELEYIFKHHLIEEAAYRGLLLKERRALHWHVAHALEDLGTERIEERVEMLAYHWERAGEVEKAAKYLFEAGDRARRCGASLEAVDFYTLALQKAGQLKAAQRPVGLHEIHERMGDLYLENLSRHAQALEHYRAFLKLATSEEDAARAGRKLATVHWLRGNLTQAKRSCEAALARLAALAPSAETSRVRYCLARVFLSRNQLDQAARHAEAGLHISQQMGDWAGLASAYAVLGIIANQRGELEAALEYDVRSLQLYREQGDLPRVIAACNNVGDSYRLLGRTDVALARLNEGLELARRLGDTRDEALLLETIAELCMDQGEWETAIQRSQAALLLAQRSGVTGRIIEAQGLLGSAYEALGRLDIARGHLEQAERLMRETRQTRYAARLYLDLAHLDATEGRFDEADRHIGLALRATGPQPSEAFLGLMHLCRGHWHARQGQWNEAVSHLEEALAQLERSRFLSQVGRTRLELGAAYSKRGHEGDGDRAREQLFAALGLFRHMGGRGYLAQAEAKLEELGCRTLHSDGAMLVSGE